jgi:hypothetical protein
MCVRARLGFAGLGFAGLGLLCVVSPQAFAQVRSTDELFPHAQSSSSPQVPLPEGKLRPAIDDIRGADNTVWLAAGATHIDYAERADNGLNIDSERGTMPALAGGFSYLDRYTNVYLAMDADGAWGKLRYDGGTLFTGRSVTMDTEVESTWSAHYRTGYAFEVGPSVMLIPLVQIGYRQWNRNLSSIQWESYHNWTVTGGLLAQYAPLRRLVLSLRGELGESFGGRLKARDEAFPDFLRTLNFDLGNELTWNVEAKAGYMVSSRWEVFTRVAFDRLEYGRSEDEPIPGAFFEPNSHTDTITTQIGGAYRFQ